MPIVFEVTPDDRLRPVFRCDVCGEVIEHHDQGIIAWSDAVAGDRSQGQDLPYKIVHKGRCDGAFKQALGGPVRSSWTPIGFFVARLCKNSGIDVKREAQLIAVLGDLA